MDPKLSDLHSQLYSPTAAALSKHAFTSHLADSDHLDTSLDIGVATRPALNYSPRLQTKMTQLAHNQHGLAQPGISHRNGGANLSFQTSNAHNPGIVNQHMRGLKHLQLNTMSNSFYDPGKSREELDMLSG